MPKDPSIKKVLVIGSGPIVIGQAAEFDYAGTQACRALREEGVRVVLVNSNPATIMTDESIADAVYIEPLTLSVLSEIIRKERPDGLLATLGGQTGLNMAVELSEAGVLDLYDVKLLGTNLQAIQKAEDRELFKALMEEIEEPVAKSKIIEDVETGLAFAKEIGYPVIVRPAYTLGGTGGGIASTEAELKTILHTGISLSRIGQVLLEQSVAGWKEIEYEVMRDANGTSIIVCNMENFDPVGVHTGDSIVVAPTQTLTDNEAQMLRTSALTIIDALKIEGGCNVQVALDPDSKNYVVIEVNPRVSRSSALASKAAGYPIAKVAAKIALGLWLDEIPNAVTQKTMASYEPSLDYVVVKIPKWPFDKFAEMDNSLGTQMKATGEVMAIARSFESALFKAIVSLEGDEVGLGNSKVKAFDDDVLFAKIERPTHMRIFELAELIRRGYSVATIGSRTKIDAWFLQKIQRMVEMENRLIHEALTTDLLVEAERMGFVDQEIKSLTNLPEEQIDALRRAKGIYPIYKMVDTCAAEFESATPYYYSSYDWEDERVSSDKEKILVIGSGPIRIGQGIEFDYCSVHALQAIQKAGFEAVLINNNPETVSTDFDIADKLYFEPLFVDDVMNVIRAEKPKGVIVQFGGQTAVNLGPKLRARGVSILGTSVESMDAAEDRNRFEWLLEALGVRRPIGGAVHEVKEAIEKANEIGYPVLVRPSYVIGGRGMQVVKTEKNLIDYVQNAIIENQGQSILVDEYIEGLELEVDAICDGEEILIPGIMTHVERTGVHSGDSISVYPPRNLSQAMQAEILETTRVLGKALHVRGLMNIQYVLAKGKLYVIEVNPRASRTVPILSKVTGVPMVDLAISTMLGKKLVDLGFGTGLMDERPLVAVKVPVFSNQKLVGVLPLLSPEMKSTGEVLGLGKTYQEALYKGFLGAGIQFQTPGKIWVAGQDEAVKEKLQAVGYDLIDELDGSMVESSIQAGDLQWILDTTLGHSEKEDLIGNVRKQALVYDLPCFSSPDTVEAYLEALEYWQTSGPIQVDIVQNYRKEVL
ncbi:carbamoyl-phosphate synthase (glutamine-hydrolyzing) large subunit [Gottschalkiaceae bacterium SANA]|nr:carbamoyl-phosphate synthase (glutamine-hydrolyzing) large subunit [Gottschalkiaceae bacterium SANA]